MKHEVRLKAYPVIREAISSGIAFGIRRAYKHTDTPGHDVLQEQIEQEIMNALEEVIDFDKSG